MKEIPLTQGQVAIVDDEDFEKLSQWKWCASAAKYGFYAVRGALISEVGYPRLISMHRVILGIDGLTLMGDHINGNKLDNRRSNLRVANHIENKRSYRHSATSKTSKWRGVSWDKSRNNWQMQIHANGRKIMKRFCDENDAAQAYNFYAVSLFGEFATENVV